jgi:hypothetical protein
MQFSSKDDNYSCSEDSSYTLISLRSLKDLYESIAPEINLEQCAEFFGVVCYSRLLSLALL